MVREACPLQEPSINYPQISRLCGSLWKVRFKFHRKNNLGRFHRIDPFRGDILGRGIRTEDFQIGVDSRRWFTGDLEYCHD